jgi:hypothetical protein
MHLWTPCLGCACAITLLGTQAGAGPIELQFLLFELDYGVFADGGGAPPPLQGPVTITDEGTTKFTWAQEDGVALAAATAVAGLSIDETSSSLTIGGSLDTTAMAIVGDEDWYEFETGIAEAYLSQLLISFSVNEQSVLSVLESPAELEGYGTIEPGHQQILEPGLYDLTYPGGYDTGSSVSVGANESAFAEHAWAFGVEVVVLPCPSAAALLGANLIVRRRRRD